MLRSTIRVFFALAVSLSLALGVFAGVGTGQALAASQSPTASGYNPSAAVPPGVNYCYPSGYNRNGWRCGWRLAQAPYNLGYYNNGYYGYNYGYGYNPYNYGTGGPYGSNVVDYGGLPRYNPYYYNYYYNYYNPYYYGYPR